MTYNPALFRAGESVNGYNPPNKEPVILGWYQGPPHKDTGLRGNTHLYFWGYDEAPDTMPPNLATEIETRLTDLYGYPIRFHTCEQLNANEIKFVQTGFEDK